MSLRFFRYVSTACVVGTAAWGCDRDSANVTPPDDVAADTAGGGEAPPPNPEMVGEANAMPANADVTNGNVVPSKSDSSSSTANLPATPEVIEPAWSDNLRVCPPSPGFPVAEYGLTRQNHIDEFEGCERIDASLTIEPYEGLDLRPLRSLREVRGRLTIGDRFTAYPHGFPSLEGLEGLRRVRGLTLAGIQANDLSVFRNLERMDDPERTPSFDGASLEIIQAEHLVDLRGLENVRGIYSLRVESSPALRSLQGVHLTPHPQDGSSVFVSDGPVEDFADVTTQTHLGTLWLQQTTLQSLQAFQPLRSVGRLVLSRNSQLVDVGALAQLESLKQLEIEGNPLLTALPDLPNMTTLVGIRLVSNALLAHAPAFPQVSALSSLLVQGNPALERFDAFPALTQLGEGTISYNSHLLGFDLSALVEVTGTLLVRDNPELDASSLAGVKGRIKRSGNRDAAPTLLSPCPWTDDDECDEPPYSELCAPGTDPICALDY